MLGLVDVDFVIWVNIAVVWVDFVGYLFVFYCGLLLFGLFVGTPVLKFG